MGTDTYGLVDIDDDKENDIDIIECRGCEVRYSITLGADCLHEDARYCPFCGEYNIKED